MLTCNLYTTCELDLLFHLFLDVHSTLFVTSLLKFNVCYTLHKTTKNTTGTTFCTFHAVFDAANIV